MGLWKLAGGKKRRRSHKRRGRGRSASGWQAPAVGGLLFVVAVLLARSSLGPAPESLFRVDPAAASVLAAPDWVDPQLQQVVQQALQTLPCASLRDEDSLRDLLRRVPSATGWIEGVEKVHKRYPRQLELTLVLRRPVALVDTVAGLQLVDAAGILVGPVAEAPGLVQQERLPLIHRPGRIESVQRGEVLEDPALRHGLAVAAEFRPYRERLRRLDAEVAVIDVAPLLRGDATSDVNLYTTQGLRIEWGRSDRHPLGPLGLSSRVKMRNLVAVLGSTHTLADVEAIQVQFDRPVMLRKRSPDGAAMAGPTPPAP